MRTKHPTQEEINLFIKHAEEGWNEKVEDFLRAYPGHVDAKDSMGGRTALMMAASWGYIETMKILLAAGADPAAEDDVGNMPRAFALNYHRPEAAALLEGALREKWLKETDFSKGLQRPLRVPQLFKKFIP